MNHSFDWRSPMIAANKSTAVNLFIFCKKKHKNVLLSYQCMKNMLWVAFGGLSLMSSSEGCQFLKKGQTTHNPITSLQNPNLPYRTKPFIGICLKTTLKLINIVLCVVPTEIQTRDILISSVTLYHWAIEPPMFIHQKHLGHSRNI